MNIKHNLSQDVSVHRSTGYMNYKASMVYCVFVTWFGRAYRNHLNKMITQLHYINYKCVKRTQMPHRIDFDPLPQCDIDYELRVIK